jgi:glycine cleavage system H protein
MSGTITEINPGLEANPEAVNTDPYGAGWMVKMTISQPDETASLLSADVYSSQVA